MNATTTLTQQFRTEFAKGVVPAILKTIKNAKWKTVAILVGVMAISYPHQAKYLSTDPSFGKLAYVIPLVIDGAMLTLVGIVQTVGMRRDAKRAALVMVVVCGAISAGINIAAPGTLFARIIFGLIVLVAVGVKWAASKMGPDFTEIEQREVELAAPVRPTRTVDPEAAARRSTIREFRKTFEALTVPQLKDQCRSRGLAVSGSKAELVTRLATSDVNLVQMQQGQVPANAPTSPAMV